MITEGTSLIGGSRGEVGMLRLRETVRKRTVSRKLSMTGRESLCLGSFALLGGCKGTCPLRDLCFSKRCDIHHCIPRYQPIPCHAANPAPFSFVPVQQPNLRCAGGSKPT